MTQITDSSRLFLGHHGGLLEHTVVVIDRHATGAGLGWLRGFGKRWCLGRPSSDPATTPQCLGQIDRLSRLPDPGLRSSHRRPRLLRRRVARQ